MIEHDVAIFAGGAGRRIGGGKPAVLLAGRPLVAWVAAALCPGARRIGIVARDAASATEIARLAAAGLAEGAVAAIPPPSVEAWTDAPVIEGPVAALVGAARAASAPRLLTAPVDTPFLPRDLAKTLAAALDADATAAAAVACEASPDARLHPTVALYDRPRLAGLEPRGSLRATLAPLPLVLVPLAPDCLFNVNTADDLALAERLVAEVR